MDSWRQLPSGQNPGLLRIYPRNTNPHNSPNSSIFEPLFTLKISRLLDKRENKSLDDVLVYMDSDLGALHEVSLINIPPTFTNHVGKSVTQVYNPATI